MRKAEVRLSGGLDSATALALALRDGFECDAPSVDYGQRHCAELDGACGACDSCRIRRAGFAGACIGDPTRYLQHA